MDKKRRDEAQQRAELLSESPIGTLERGLLLLELFDADNSEMSLNQLRERAGLPKATIQRLMKTLEARRWVAYDSATRKYRLGASVLRISYLAASHSELVRVTHPFLVRLAEETRETASLCVWTDLGPLMLDTVLTPRHFKPATNIGMILGLATADGQVLVAFGPEEAWDGHLANPIPRHTELTVTDPDQAPRALADRQGRRCGVRQGRVEPRDPRRGRTRLRPAGPATGIDGYRTPPGASDRRSNAEVR